MKNLLQERHLIEARRAIVKDFYRCFDSAWIATQLQAPADLTLLGEGRHFRSFRLSTRGSLDLALQVAKPAFTQTDDTRQAFWTAQMRRLQKIVHPLLPPFEIISDSANLSYVLPYCEQPLAAPEWRELGMQPELDELTELLAQHGLQLDDYWQLRRCRQHPFVIDYSELRER